MASNGWMFVLSDLQGNVLGEVTNAAKRQVVLPLKGLPTCQFTIKTGHALAANFENPNWDGLVKAYRNGSLKFHGQVVSSQEVGGQGTADGIQVNAAGPFRLLNYRFAGIPLTNGGVINPYQDGSASSPLRCHILAQNLITLANAEGYTGISLGATTSASDGAVGPYYLQPIGDAITSLSSGAAAFEWEIPPTEPVSVGQPFPQIGVFNSSPLLGSVKSNVVFEYGMGASNVSSYSNAIDRQGLMTLGYMTQPAVTDYSDCLLLEDTGATTARGRYLGVVDNGGVQWDNFRANLLSQHIAVRARARQVLGFVPKPNANYQPTIDYNIGDQVRCRVTKDGVFKFDAMFRVWGIQFDMTEEGNETPTLTLVPT